MADNFKNFPPQIAGPYENAAAVTTSDTVDLPNVSCELIAAGSGNISVDTVGGQTAVTIGITAGIPLKLRATRVRATGTTATGIVALW